MKTAKPFQWRALLRYRLRSLLLVATGIAVGLAAWVQLVEKPYERQAAALAALGKLTPQVEFDDSQPHWLPAWVANRFRWAVSLHLERQAVRDEHLVHIGQLPHLKRLYLARTRVTDQGMQHLAGLTKLRRISLWGTAVSDEGLKHLAGLRQLEALDVHETKCTSACLAHLEPAQRMKTLRFDFELDDRGAADLERLCHHHEGSLDCRDLSLAGLSALRPIQGLASLSLRGASIGVPETNALVEIPGLVRLRLSEGRVVDGAALSVLQGSSSLREVHLVEMGVAPGQVLGQYAPSMHRLSCGRSTIVIGFTQPPRSVTVTGNALAYNLAELPRAPELRFLWVDREADGTGLDFRGLVSLQELVWLGAMRESQVRQLGALSNLEKLVQRLGPGLSPSAFEPLRGLHRIKTLSLSQCHLTDEHLGFLEGLTSLHTLHLGENPLQGACLARLQQLPQLQHLSLQECKTLADVNLAYVAKIKSLAVLNLQYTPVTDEGLEALFGMPNLKNVLLLGSRVTPRGRAALKAHLPGAVDVY